MEVGKYSFEDFKTALGNSSKQYEIVEKDVAENIKSIFTKAAQSDGDGDDQTFTADEISWQSLIKTGLACIKRVPNIMKNSMPNNEVNEKDS